MKFPLRRDFDAYLRESDPELIVGIAESSEACPLAVWLHHEGYELDVQADGWAVNSDTGHPVKPLPVWMRRFIRRIDAGWHGEVQAADAVRVLERTRGLR